MKSKNSSSLFKILIALALSSQVYASDDDPSTECIKNLASAPDLSILKDKIALSDIREQTLEMLSNRKKPLLKEKKGISLWIVEAEKCMQDGEQWRELNYPAQLNARINTFVMDFKSLAASLYGDELSYGEFARKRAAITAVFQNDSTEIVQALLSKQTEQAELKNQKAQEASHEQARQNQQQAYQEKQLRLQEEFQAQQDLNSQRQNIINYMSNQRPVTPVQIPLYQMRPIQIPNTSTTRCQYLGNQLVCNTN
ncbi:hypothetical protein EBAPG3_013255 [Nitrosospira lacus]|uniref:Uncharacterized protein n=1 Tax=Nitrosospira lacus TaxID=1288494 RepID=A0A1W6SS98_9PROT|nr:hypothetical protein [Nitrosospira lacus]ARO88659.1 hypothetical protein EBAPG3_013255 [Nitrosospira lacus]